jgi:hypothetical protein
MRDKRVRRVTYATHDSIPIILPQGRLREMGPFRVESSTCCGTPVRTARRRDHRCPQSNIKPLHLILEFRGSTLHLSISALHLSAPQRPEMPVRPNRSALADKRVASKIAPRLYLTCLATAKDVSQLADLGITHVVSAIENAPVFPSTYPLRTLHVSISDYDGEDILSHLPVTTSFIRGALAENPKNRILVRTYYDGLCAKGAASNTVVTCGDLNRFTASWASAGVQLL